jgi:hypothetical protein
LINREGGGEHHHYKQADEDGLLDDRVEALDPGYIRAVPVGIEAHHVDVQGTYHNHLRVFVPEVIVASKVDSTERALVTS